jgi:hypothetical protein
MLSTRTELGRLDQAIADTERRITQQQLRIEQWRRQGHRLSAAIQHLRVLEDGLRIRQEQRQLLLNGALSPYPRPQLL